MWKSLLQLDELLRGEKTRINILRSGEIPILLGSLIFVIGLLGLVYGVCMGTFSLLREDGPEFRQLIATMIKVPCLFGLTLLITFPSLYVFNALIGSQLLMKSVFKLLVASIGVTLAMLAAFGPIVAFFSLSTSSYQFMVLLNVLVFAVSGLLGLKFLLQTLHRLSIIQDETRSSPNPAVREVQVLDEAGQPLETVHVDAPRTPGPLDPLDGHILQGHVKLVFRCWLVIYGLVGAQLSWVLRPFIGNPDQPFTWFRPRDSNFFQAVIETIGNLITG